MHFLSMVEMLKRIPYDPLYFFGWNHLALIGSYSFLTRYCLSPIYFLAIGLVFKLTSVQKPNLNIDDYLEFL